VWFAAVGMLADTACTADAARIDSSRLSVEISPRGTMNAYGPFEGESRRRLFQDFDGAGQSRLVRFR
jgi:hypothetical protein